MTGRLTGAKRIAFKDLWKDRLARGETPTAEELANAPVLNDWSETTRRGGLPALYGHCQAHPVHGSDFITTAPIIGVDTDAGWLVTEGRIYRLGAAYRPTDIADFDDEEDDNNQISSGVTP